LLQIPVSSVFRDAALLGCVERRHHQMI